jgi:hypothetical protein
VRRLLRRNWDETGRFVQKRSVIDDLAQHDSSADVGKLYMTLASLVGWKKSLQNAV